MEHHNSSATPWHKNAQEDARWDEVVQSRAPVSGAFLQSSAWAQFQASLGRRVMRLRCGPLIAQAVELSLPLHLSYWYLPKGPLCQGMTSPRELNDFAEFCCASLPGIFVRVEPGFSAPSTAEFHPTGDIQPSHSWITDLSQGFESLLPQMHEKTRYNIRLAKRHGVTVSILSAESFEDAWEVFSQTAARDGFRLHPKSYYEALLATPGVTLWGAFFEAQLLATAITIDFVSTRTYLHGASSDLHREHMAPYALHAQMMEQAATLGLTAYDWWGVAPEGAGAEHPWAGITRFKKGFGGKSVTSSGAFDIPCHPFLYRLYRLARRSSHL